MNKLCCLIIILLAYRICGGQNLVINGDFENNTAGTCLYNLPNASFNSMMSDCYAFGINGEIDIQNGSCGYSAPAQGTWFISLATNPVNLPDALSLFLSTPLNSGIKYYVSYYEKADTSFNNIDSLLIGVSSDSSIFGIQIYSSLPVVQNGWTHKSFSFISPLTGKYLTFATKEIPDGWNFIDGVCISTDSLTCNSTVGINEIKNNDELILFPNPFSDKLNITAKRNELVEVNFFDLTGRKTFNQSFTNSTSINTEQLAKGIYFYEVRNKNGVVKKGKVVKE